MEGKQSVINLYIDKCESRKTPLPFKTRNEEKTEDFKDKLRIPYILDDFFYNRYNVLFNRLLSMYCIEQNSIGVVYDFKYKMCQTSVEFIFRYMIFVNNIEKPVDKYINTIKIFLINNYPPFLGLIFKYGTYYIREFFAITLCNQLFTEHSANNLSFQIIYILTILYKNNIQIEHFSISLLGLDKPVDLIFNVGMIQFTLNDVDIIGCFLSKIKDEFNIF